MNAITHMVVECCLDSCGRRTDAEKKTSGMKRCGGCRTNYYCSAECQAKDWPRHKKKCVKDPVGRITCERLRALFIQILRDPTVFQIFRTNFSTGESSKRLAISYAGDSPPSSYGDRTVLGALAVAFISSCIVSPQGGDVPRLVFSGPLLQCSLHPTPGKSRFFCVDFYSTTKEFSCVSCSIEIPLDSFVA